MEQFGWRVDEWKRNNSGDVLVAEEETLKTADQVKKEIARRYSVDPDGWQVLYGRKPGGISDLMVVHGSDMWMIKENLVNPRRSIGLGAKGHLREGEEIKTFSPYSFGLRPLPREQMEELMLRLVSGKSTRKMMRAIMMTRPSSPKDITSPVVMQGPVVYSERPIELISETHRELSEKLDEELEKLLYKKYPSRMGMYR